jgi:hypothetical protein
MLRAARTWFATTTLEELLDREFANKPGCRVLFDSSVRIDHIGFLVPRWAKDILSQAATEAGFPLGHRAFPSALIARELGRLSGKRRLATQIFKAYAHGDAAPAFEAFIPAADDATVGRWIADGVIDHVAVVVPPERFQEIRSTLVGAGFAIAGFMYGRAVYLPGEDATMTYFDLGGGEHPYRLEVRTRGDFEDKSDDDA